MQRRRPELILAAFAAALAACTVAADAAAPANYQGLTPASPVTAIKRLGTITVKGSCPHDADARITAEYPIQWPEVALEQGVAPADSTVLIDLDTSGNLLGARIATSSGNALLDEEALLGARMSKYAAEIHDCAAIARSYYLIVKFELTE